MHYNDKILIGGGSESPVFLNLNMANRHGLIAGATGTGKTITLQVLAEQFSHAGVPVFTADVKGDLSGLAAQGSEHPKVTERLDAIGIDSFSFQKSPVAFWDLYKTTGIPIRATVADMGPLLLSRLFELNDTQTGVLESAFRISEDQDLPLVDTKDLKSLLQYMSENAANLRSEYGNMGKSTIGAILRDVASLEDAGGDIFFAEPALKLADLLLCDEQGRGYINILDATKLINDGKLYSTFLLWLLNEIFATFDEVGDPEKPKMVFFFDEAHLLFRDAPKALIERMETVVRLIRSKGVGIYFVTQNPVDVPETILGQLGNRIQHALRAFSPRDQKAVKAAAQTFRPNPNFATADVITQLKTGESLVSVLDENGAPTVVERVLNAPPRTQIGPIGSESRRSINEESVLFKTYAKDLDRESAYEMLKTRRKDKEKTATAAKTKRPQKPRSYRRQSRSETFFKAFLRSIAGRLATIATKVIVGMLKK